MIDEEGTPSPTRPQTPRTNTPLIPFATLAERFEQQSSNIYRKFSARNTPSDQPYISILPDSGASSSRIKNDNRALPILSVRRDTERISKFLRSSDGVLFIAKQTLLQTGNTFADTKLFNPLSPLLNTVPFVHARRNIPTKVLVPNPSGLLQNTTVDTISSKFTTTNTPQNTTGRRQLLPTIGGAVKNYVATQLKNAANSIIPLPQSYESSRPEYKIFYTNNTTTGPRIFRPQPLNERGIPRLNINANIKNKVVSSLSRTASSALTRFVPKSLRKTIAPIIVQPETDSTLNPYESFVTTVEKFKQNFYNKENLKTSKIGVTQNDKISSGQSTSTTRPNQPLTVTILANADADRLNSKYFTERLLTNEVVTKGNTNIRDPYQYGNNFVTLDTNGLLDYGNIIEPENEKKTDIVKFRFCDADGSNPVYFRALISSIKESVKPEFNEQRYVGRTERFVTYGGAKRSVNLTFNIVAFSREEVDAMWMKVNYLTGLAFPKGVQNGFMIPPLFKLTVGGLYDNQPCYIESLDYDFLDETITFDIDREVPFAINVIMQLSVLEKRSKFYNSPFYQITENASNVAEQRKEIREIVKAVQQFIPF